ncbi:hypothetical protein ABFV99_13695 [Cytobacillus horneckiae]|uniref:hypothetical protein n=1 Tax=Cytobacillus horneckiae TaxID=549687 RepID=UPI0034D0181D
MLNKRILGSINEQKYVAYQIGEDAPKGYTTLKEFEDEASANYQSVKDLISRRNEIKSKLILANATTTVLIAGKEMTIAEAIDQKDFIDYKQSLLNELKRQLSLNVQMIDREQREMELRLDKRLESDFGSKDRKNHVNEIEQTTTNFKNRNQPALVDPISIRKEIENLETEINDFLVDVDAVLSEANATNFIEVA